MNNFVEWAQGIYRVVGDVGEQGIEYASYLVLGDEKIAVIDIPSRSVGKDIISFVKREGRDPSEIRYLILTHSHPDHWAGMDSLSKIKPQVWFHESGMEALKEGKKFILDKQFPKPSKFGLAMKTSLFSKIGKVKEELLHPFGDSETLDLGGEELILQNSGGHSVDSILIQAYRGGCTFIGDEGNIYPDQPAAFYIDGTGSPNRRMKLLELIGKIKTEVICPAHQAPVPRPVDLYLNNLTFEHKHTKDTIYDLLVSAGQAKAFYLAEEYQRALGFSWETPFKELGVAETTVNAFLEELEKEGKVRYETHSQRWSVIS
ncbi:MAG: MBL fold metallo-hydrolase [Candidatus Heimdallarchaeota archaeon]|nr:MAG: MBL fold metallo-hydrolase [Candidatus Heimdallarchaeota archaeon]